MKKFTLLLLIMFVFLFVAGHSYASDLTVQCSDSSCATNGSQQLFTGSDIWAPGNTESKTIQIQNISNSSKHIGITPSNNVTGGALDTILNLIVKRNSDNVVLYSGNLNSFYNTGTIYLDTLASNATNTYSLSVVMDPSAGNEYQNKTTTFDLSFGFDVSDANGGTGGNNSNNNVNTNNSNNSDNNQNNTSGTPDVLAANTFNSTGQLFAHNPAQNNSLLSNSGDVLGTQSAETTSHSLNKSIASKCSTALWWILIYVLQIIGVFLIGFLKRKLKIFTWFAQGITGIIAAIILWIYFCQIWFVVISIFITLAGFLFIKTLLPRLSSTK